MSGRIIQNADADTSPKKAVRKVHVKAPIVSSLRQDEIAREMEAVLSRAKSSRVESSKTFMSLERAQFYAGNDRLNLQGSSVQRVRELEEENDHLQREITSKGEELIDCTDPLVSLAEIEHKKIIVARNTGEILEIYLRNEDRLKRIQDLQSHNILIQGNMMDMQGRFIETKDMNEKTKFASEFFVLKSELERNLHEIADLSKK